MTGYLMRRPARLATGTLLSLLVGCGGVMQFKDDNAISITAKAPPPPKPEPKPEPKPKRVSVTADAIVISEKIHFEVDKATIMADSNGLLDEIVDVLKEHTQIKKVSIEGHTDSDGSGAHNDKLSKARAKAVLDYLVAHGVAAGRLTSKGFGESKPLASNDTPDGKEKNRRVEFLIIEQDKVNKTVLVDPKTGKPVSDEEAGQ